MKRIKGRSFVRIICGALSMLTILTPALAGYGTAWKQALAPRAWQFPRDHGAHPEYRTEWWYFTGNLTDAAGNRYGYELTFFREGIERSPGQDYVWSLRNLYLAHFAVTDVSRRHFIADDRVSRSGPGLAGSSTGRLNVWLRDWSARAGSHTPLVLRAKNDTLRTESGPRAPQAPRCPRREGHKQEGRQAGPGFILRIVPGPRGERDIEDARRARGSRSKRRELVRPRVRL